MGSVASKLSPGKQKIALLVFILLMGGKSLMLIVEGFTPDKSPKQLSSVVTGSINPKLWVQPDTVGRKAALKDLSEELEKFKRYEDSVKKHGGDVEAFNHSFPGLKDSIERVTGYK